MANIQKTLDSLQPYVIGIRYLEGMVVVDTVFKDGWTIPDDASVKKIKGNDDMNYYMLFSDVTNIGLDDILAYVERVIKINQEREKKHELLKEKVNQLKELFKKNSLTKLNRLKFTFGEEDLTPSFSEIDVEEEVIIEEPERTQQPNIAQEEPITTSVNTQEPIVYLDENGNQPQLSSEDLEILEEEKRAARFLATRQQKKTPQPRNFELPPKKQPMVTKTTQPNCDCGPDEACNECMDTKYM